jgi:hypothetical protein
MTNSDSRDGTRWLTFPNLGATGTEHVFAAAVAVLIGLSAFWYGGFIPEVTAGISILAWWILLVGAASGLLPVADLGPKAIAMLALFLGLALLIAGSVSWAADGGRAFVKLVQFTAVFGIFSVALTCSRPSSARSWAAGITGGLLFIVILAALSRFLPGIGDDVELTTNLSGVEGRLSWPLGYWNATGACAAMCATGLAWFGANARTEKWKALAVSGIPLAGVVIYLTSSRGATVALLLGMVVLVLFGPRRRLQSAAIATGLAGAAILILVAAQMYALVHAENSPGSDQQGIILMLLTITVSLAVYAGWRRIEPQIAKLAPWRPNRWLLVTAALIVLAAVVAANPPKLYERFTEEPEQSVQAGSGENATTAHLLSTAGTGRSEYWSTAVDAFASEPFRGIGAGGFETYYTANRDSGLVGRHTHSLPLQVLAELGILGFVLLLSIIALTVLTALERWQLGRLRARSEILAPVEEVVQDSGWSVIPALAAIGTAGSFSMSIDWTAEFPLVVAPVVIAVACIVGPATTSLTRDETAVSRSRGRDIGASVLILIAGISIWVAATGFSVATNLAGSRDAVSSRDFDTAATKARAAIDALPLASEPRVQLALIEELQGTNRKALATLNDAIERAPDSSSSYLLKARILLRLSREKQARVAFNKAQQLDPNGLFFSE